MLNEIISAAALVLVAVIEAFAAGERKRFKSDRAKTEARAKTRAEESRLSMQMMSAALELGVATALAVEEHKLNGEMHRAKEKAQKAQDDYAKFVREITAGQIAKV